MIQNIPLIRKIFHLSNADDAESLELEIKGLSQEDIKSLRKTDPFMYYSIPGIHRAAINLEEIDHSSENALCQGQVHCRRHSSPAELERPATRIPRRTIISFEAHPCLLLEDLLKDDA